jgi:signal transduction histidine kinase/DNA-binding response OmpR family regulator/sugar lactone lactonase YvrE
MLYDGSRLWVYSIDGIWSIDPVSKEWTDQSRYIGDHVVANCMGLDANGNIWIGQDRLGVNIIDKQGRLTKLSEQDEFESHSVSSVYTDDNGSVWIGTYKKGLYQYNENMFKFQLKKFSDVNCITGSAHDVNVVWVGTDDGKLIRWNYADNKTETYPCSNTAIVCMMAQKNGDVWAGTYLNGLKKMSGGHITSYSDKDGLATNNIWALCASPDGNVWVGTLGGGVQLFDPAKGKVIETYNTGNSGLLNDYINSMIISRTGDLVIGTTMGVSIFNHNTKQFTNKLGSHDGSKSFQYPNIIQVVEDLHGLLWMATIEGLYVYDDKTDKLELVNIPKKQNPYILGLAEDNVGEIWVSIGAEIIKVVAHRDGKNALTFNFDSYNQKDGLQNSDFNQRSFYRTPDGIIFVGGLYGVNAFNPQNIKYNKNVPHVMFSDFRLFGQSIAVGEKYKGRVILKSSINTVESIELNYSQNDFTIDFASDNYVNPESTVFYYRMEGFNDEWIECDPGVYRAVYTNLSPGEYTFQVKAVNADGVESAEPASMKIIIYPPFWATTWAKIYYLVVLISAVILLIRYFRQRDNLKYLKEKREEDIKHKEEMAQLKMQFFTNVSHDLRTPLTLILSPIDSMIGDAATDKQRNRLNMIKNNANRLLTMINQLLDYRKIETTGLNYVPSDGNIVGFVKELTEGFTEYAENRGVKLLFKSSHNVVNMMFDTDKMSKIFQNLLSNAFKFTPSGGSITVSVNSDGETLTMKVADTGIGIADEDKDQVFLRFYQAKNTNPVGTGIGLSLVKEYVLLHKGDVTVSDNKGGGTVFTITMPIDQSQAIETAAQKNLNAIHAAQAVEEAAKGVAPAATSKPAAAAKTEPAEKADVAEKTEKAEAGAEAEQKADDANKMKLLIVDDNDDLLNFMYSEFEAEYKVYRAHDGVEALELMHNDKPDLVLTDYMMPNMDGMELCRQMKADKALKGVPVILLSAKHDMEAKMEGMKAGADDYITKPFNIDMLRMRVQKMVEARHTNTTYSRIDVEPSLVEITPVDEKLVNTVKKYIEENMSNPELTVDDVITHANMGMSKINFYKRLRRATDKTPMEFMRSMRMKRAAQLLRESELNVSEVAYEVGYNNPRYFSIQFKEEYGISPSNYQEKERQK